KGIVGITSELALLRPAIGVDDAIVAIAASDQHENAFAVAVFGELKSIRKLILTRTARRHAVEGHWIVLPGTALAKFVQIPCPFLEWGNLIYVGDVFQQTIRIHADIGTSLDQTGRGRCRPKTGLSGSWTQPGLSIGPFGRGCRRSIGCRFRNAGRV